LKMKPFLKLKYLLNNEQFMFIDYLQLM